jgi:hypothetical protein
MARYTIGPAFGLQATVAVAGVSVSWPIWVGDQGGGAANLGQYPDNCHTVIIYNSHAANTLLVGSDLSEIGNPISQAFRIPPLGTMTIAIGAFNQRVHQSSFGALADGFLLDATGANTVADITFVCGITV